MKKNYLKTIFTGMLIIDLIIGLAYMFRLVNINLIDIAITITVPYLFSYGIVVGIILEGEIVDEKSAEIRFVEKLASNSYYPIFLVINTLLFFIYIIIIVVLPKSAVHSITEFILWLLSMVLMIRLMNQLTDSSKKISSYAIIWSIISIAFIIIDFLINSILGNPISKQLHSSTMILLSATNIFYIPIIVIASLFLKDYQT